MTKSNKIQARSRRVERFLYTLIKLDLIRDYSLWSTLNDPSTDAPKNIDQDKYYNYWNRPVQKGQDKAKPDKWDPKGIRHDPFESDVTYWMNEEDTEAEPYKLLRPLYLLPTTKASAV